MIEWFKNSILVTAALSWFVAQLLKMIFVLLRDKKLDFYRMVGSGGMPSSHSAFVVSLAAAVGIREGFNSTLFAVSAVMALVVMYDAAGVRRAAGQQARLLNQIVERWETDDFENREKRLKELLGHTPTEVIGGAVLGALIGIIRHM